MCQSLAMLRDNECRKQHDQQMGIATMSSQLANENCVLNECQHIRVNCLRSKTNRNFCKTRMIGTIVVPVLF